MEDLYSTVEVIIFPREYEKYMDIIDEDAIVYVDGQLTVKEDEGIKIIAQKFEPVKKMDCRGFYIKLESIDGKRDHR